MMVQSPAEAARAGPNEPMGKDARMDVMVIGRSTGDALLPPFQICTTCETRPPGVWLSHS